MLRRDVLKVAALPVVAGAAGALSGFGRETAMTSRPLMTVKILAAPGRYYFRTVPRFETSADRYAYLNLIVAVGVGEARPDGAVHRIEEIL